ncbi:hypothetical protein [Methanothermobacter thermautotrophicus]|nr:hypothetical protein [Methanothermobacter thermautotrophicus]
MKPVKVAAAKHTYKKKRVHTKAYYRKKVYKRKTRQGLQTHIP